MSTGSTGTLYLHAKRPSGSHAWMSVGTAPQVLAEFIRLCPEDTDWSLTDNTVHRRPAWAPLPPAEEESP
jgi:hypothetical protein